MYEEITIIGPTTPTTVLQTFCMNAVYIVVMQCALNYVISKMKFLLMTINAILLTICFVD